MTIWKPETDVPCECKTIPNAAEEPDVPIVFDTTTGEYHLIHGQTGEGQMVLYYCFFSAVDCPHLDVKASSRELPMPSCGD